MWAVVSQPIDMKAVERVKVRARPFRGPAPASSSELDAEASAPHGYLCGARGRHSASSGGNALLPSSSTAFAQAIEQLKSAGAFLFTDLIYSELENDPIEAQVMVADDGRERRKTSDIVSLMDSDGQLRLTLIERTKTAIVAQPTDVPHVPAQRQLGWLEQLKSHGTKPDKELGTKTLDGRTVEGFVAKQEDYEFTIWVDAKTNDLVQIESDGMIEFPSWKSRHERLSIQSNIR